MYLHLGRDTVIRTNDIVGIFDIETASVGKTTRQFLSLAEQRMAVTNVSDDLPKSFVVCTDGAAARVYVTQVSSGTLRRRLGFIGQLSDRMSDLQQG